MTMTVKQHRRPLIIITIVAAATLLSALVRRSSSPAPGGAARVPPPPAVARRALGTVQFRDPKTVVRKAPGPGEPVRATIYLVQKYVEAISLFHTDVLTRYGTGRLQYDVVEAKETCDAGCKVTNDHPPEEPGPCLAVSRYFKKFSCPIDHLKCNYPRCLTMVSNDEWCKIKSPFDFRQYYSASLPNSTSLPIGPRLDTWQSFQKLRVADPPLALAPASQRRYAFNAIFSQNTNKDRKKVALLIAGNKESKLAVYAKMAKSWNKVANSDRTAQVPTDAVVGVMLDSVFTLAPRGHHPECFRLFEAAEAGSILVLTTKDLTGGAVGCTDALGQWRDAPVVVLNSWNELYPTIEGLMMDPARLDQMQQDFLSWYERYMRGAVAGLEDALLASAGGAISAEALLPGATALPEI